VTFRADGDEASFQLGGGNLTAETGACTSVCTLEISPGRYSIYLSSPASKKWMSVDVQGRE